MSKTYPSFSKLSQYLKEELGSTLEEFGFESEVHYDAEVDYLGIDLFEKPLDIGLAIGNAKQVDNAVYLDKDLDEVSEVYVLTVLGGEVIGDLDSVQVEGDQKQRNEAVTEKIREVIKRRADLVGTTIEGL